ncbi:FKBP43 [Symbiodinium pilosum]|uniref:peptidylprolyl isomerase n=1 Tax=Symbiodinium pilosum TaxID=2952 RepID=A0A812QZQ9_SYMPI|nr:FKBP43 [Symbiodinium pilosum]
MAWASNRYAALFSEDEDEEGAGNDEAGNQEAVARQSKKRKLKRKRAKDKAVAAEPQDEEAPTVRSSPKRKRKASKATEDKDKDSDPPPAPEAVQESNDGSKDLQQEGLLPTGTTKTLQGGVTIKVIRAAPEGTRIATKGCEVRLMYEGRLPEKNGRRFDVGEIDFLLGDGTMLPGFAIGVAGMGVGERRLIRVPWRLGYGKKGKRPKIPPKSDLDFDASLTFCGIDWKRRVSHKPAEMSNKRREAAKRRGKKPRPV